MRNPDNPMEHRLKIDCELFPLLESGAKTCEFRRDDREYQRDDILILQEWQPTPQKYTGKEFRARITDIRHGGVYGIPDGYVLLSIVPEWMDTPMLRGTNERHTWGILLAALAKHGSIRVKREDLQVIDGSMAFSQDHSSNELVISFHPSS